MTDSAAGDSADWTPGRPVPLESILGSLRRGSGDPTWWSRPGEVWRAVRTPDGPATVRYRQGDGPGGDRVTATAWGSGATWMLSRLPVALGSDDDLRGFTPSHDGLARAHRQHRHWRVGRSELVIEALIPAVIEQRVTGKQAFGAYRRLVRRYGDVAPGPGGERDLVVPPSVERWLRIPSWEWLRAGVDAARADTLMRALRVAPALQACTSLPASRYGAASAPSGASAAGRSPRSLSAPSATPTRSASVTITWPRTSGGR